MACYIPCAFHPMRSNLLAAGSNFKHIASALSDLYGRPVRDEEITDLIDTGPVQDSRDRTSKFIAPARVHGKCFVLVSSPNNPDVVARSVGIIEKLYGVLPASDAASILKPLADGYVDGVSYAIWPLLRPLSKTRIIQSFQKRRLTPKILDWLFNVTVATHTVNDETANIESRFIAPLASIANHQGLSGGIHNTAREAIGKFRTGAIKPVNCQEHGDFWLGNIMLADGDIPGRPAFVVIDWAGASMCGYPFFDLAKMAFSLNATRAQTLRQIDRHCALFDCEREDVLAYFLCASGSLSQHLEYFPEAKFVEMTQSLFDYLRALTVNKRRGR